jgi:ferric-dicitrate binding protein FerR (iron transport regulator)
LNAPDDIPADLATLLREALAWVICLHSGAATTDEAEALAQWRRTSPDHDAAFRDAVELWRRFGDAARAAARGQAPLPRIAKPRTPESLKPPERRLWKTPAPEVFDSVIDPVNRL